MRILIVEDEKSLAELVSNRLKKEKYIVDISLDGEETNGLYTKINSYTNGEEITFSDVSSSIRAKENNKSNVLLKLLLIELSLLLIIISYYFISYNKKRN